MEPTNDHVQTRVTVPIIEQPTETRGEREGP
jgi:hypothetical protein